MKADWVCGRMLGAIKRSIWSTRSSFIRVEARVVPHSVMMESMLSSPALLRMADKSLDSEKWSFLLGKAKIFESGGRFSFFPRIMT